MYIIKTKATFDSAHFLKGYDGKCANIHGHRWTVTIEAQSEEVEKEGPFRGMVVDFGKLRGDLKEEADKFDHTLIYEEGSLSEKTEAAMLEEGFSMLKLPFRPTAENLSKHFYDLMTEKGYRVKLCRVYETPENVAEYSE